MSDQKVHELWTTTELWRVTLLYQMDHAKRGVEITGVPHAVWARATRPENCPHENITGAIAVVPEGCEPPKGMRLYRTFAPESA